MHAAWSSCTDRELSSSRQSLGRPDLGAVPERSKSGQKCFGCLKEEDIVRWERFRESVVAKL
jgi:hypothetical protein